MEYFSDTLVALNLLQQLGFDLFVVTNQSGIGRGYFGIDAVHSIHNQLQKDLEDNKLLPFKDFAICPHSPDDNCLCRKPSGKMILDLMKQYAITPEDSYMVGDKLIDAECGKNAGINGILVRHSQTAEFPYFKTLIDFAQSLKK